MTHLTSRCATTSQSHLRTGVTLRHRQCGFTMVELLVALVISLMIALAAISALTVTRRGLTTVDTASQLRDNGRFATDLIQRLAVQSGFKDGIYAGQSATQTESSANFVPNITGINNALSTLEITSSNIDPLTEFTSRTTGTLGFGSDILILRNQLVKANTNPNDADGSMIDCMGNTLTTGAAPSSRYERMTGVFHIDESPAGSGELALMCTTIDSAGHVVNKQPIVQGIENFQVLYGTEGVSDGTAPPITYGMTAGAQSPADLTITTQTPPTPADLATLASWKATWAAWSASINHVPNRYFRADQLTVTSDSTNTNTYANWRRVRSLRIGMVLRGPLNSAQEKVAQTLYPFGLAKSSSTGAPGSAMSSANDPGTVFTTPADGRLRQVVTFTVQLRNEQGL